MAAMPSIGELRSAWRDLRTIRNEGGPARVSLRKVERPNGWFLPTSEATIDVETSTGQNVRLTPQLPVPWPYAWGYRLARKLELPLAADIDPEDLRLSLPVPGFVRRTLAG